MNWKQWEEFIRRWLKRFTPRPAFLLLLTLAACTHPSPQTPQTPEDITRGSRRMVVHMPEEVSVREKWNTEVMLLGRPTAYPERLYLLVFTTPESMEMFSVAPAVQRYYLIRMRPFNPGFYPEDGVLVMTVSLHEVRGFNFLGEVQPDKALLYDVKVIRYTYEKEARK